MRTLSSPAVSKRMIFLTSNDLSLPAHYLKVSNGYVQEGALAISTPSH
jgi:hypothetical protein